MNANHLLRLQDALNRRTFLSRSAAGVGMAALGGLLAAEATAAAAAKQPGSTAFGGLPTLPDFPPKAKRVIYLFQSGAPSQMDLFDYKPKLNEFRGKNLPESIRMGQRLTGMTA